MKYDIVIKKKRDAALKAAEIAEMLKMLSSEDVVPLGMVEGFNPLGRKERARLFAFVTAKAAEELTYRDGSLESPVEYISYVADTAETGEFCGGTERAFGDLKAYIFENGSADDAVRTAARDTQPG